MPTLYILSGCNGAGKTTASYTLLPEMLECRQWVNSDEFAKALSPFSPESVSVRASRMMLLKIRYLLERKEDFGIETTLATRSLLKTVKLAQAGGYRVVLLYMWLRSPDMAVKRVKARVAAGGHNIPEDTIRRRYYVGINYFFKDYAPICERWILADNSEPPFRVVAEGGRERSLLVRDEETYVKIQTLLIDHPASDYEKGGGEGKDDTEPGV